VIRRRRTPEVAQREIVAAAEALLRERPFRELTVDEVMRRTGLSRPSFYVYFKDRHELVLRVVAHLQAELLAVANRWYESLGGGPPVLQEALEGFVRVYGEHSAELRALADAATDDPDVEAAYGALIQTFIDVTAEHIVQEQKAGDVADLDASETAKAFAWMTERYLYHAFGPVQRVPQAKVVETLSAIWTRTLYAG
jgi:AcrR family transcriptional regulator